MAPTEDRDQIQIYFCAFCNGPGTSRHHLVPKHAVRTSLVRLPLESKRKVIRLCRPCHTDVHWFFSNEELATKFNTAELLKTELDKRRKNGPIRRPWKLIPKPPAQKKNVLIEMCRHLRWPD